MKVYLKAFLDNGHVCYIDCDGFAGIYIYVKAYQIVCFKSVQLMSTHIYTERDRERVCVFVCMCVHVCVCVYERKTEPQRGRIMKGGEVREGKRK